MSEPKVVAMPTKVKVTHNQLNAGGLIAAFDKMYQLPLPIKTSYNVMKLRRKIDQSIKDAGEVYSKILKEHCELDDKGHLKPEMMKKMVGDKEVEVPIPNSFKIIEGKKEALEAKLKEFFEMSVELDWTKIPSTELEEANKKTQAPIVGTDLEALEPFILF